MAFTIKKDILLLRHALGYNPWQLGDDMWKEVADQMHQEFNEDFTPRAVKKRVDLLIDKFQKKQLKYLSGTEEETTERGLLLETIIAIKEEERAAINTEITPDDDVDIEANDEETEKDPSPPKSTAKERRLERSVADKERSSYVDEAAGPSGSRGKRQRLSVEEEVMMEKHKHDMEMEKEKIELEKLRIKSEEHREEQRLILERQREERMNDESKRRDEIAKSQIDLQHSMMKIMEKIMEK